MGVSTSDLTLGDLEELQQISSFSHKELKTLYKRFKKLDRGNVGTITSEDLMTVPSFVMNPLSPRLIDMFTNENKNGQINFRQFVQVLSPFSQHATVEEKMQFLFRIYDTNSDGFTSREEIKKTLKLMVGTHLSDEQLNVIVDKAVQDVDASKIDFPSFKKLLRNANNLNVTMVLPLAVY